MVVFLLLVILLAAADGLRMAVPGLVTHFLWVGTVDSLGMCDFVPSQFSTQVSW